MDLSNQKILITNDDGIHAEGIQLLERIVRQHCDDVWVIAPDEERSGASHSVSMHTPVRVRKVDERHFALKGTPTDCAIMAIHELMDGPPTLLLSGINRGANLAEDLTYSGTAAAAMEGALLGVPSIALSQVFTPGEDVPWQTAERFLPQVIEGILAADMAPGTFVNVNFPPVGPDAVTGLHVVDQGQRPPGSFQPEGRTDGRGVPYYWIKLRYTRGQADEGTDLWAMAENAVSICPVQLNMTAMALKDRLRRHFR
ncbi:5'/3'-nucleotidase SurE [Rhodosalinus halophilus]|jgi:5'-nucleotidase|uniref:5'-nucleotidase SurE n=1 Tax=Rhodosalinus halophilus TaxID=2259333 RepID=A0A365UBW8_9RHOB|nr:5'/3'-nucleotidase SurE [Rhodosalinus halophilus]RBI86643.1 5'/3'-nucleotidase SurE [Rhodosalinus halophilus]